jgi:putative peptidoglycan lipid II flippase
MNRARHLLQSGIMVIVLLGFDKLLGLVRTQFVGAAFGTGSDYDAFTAANQLPEVFVTLISGGALAAAFIPVYSDYLIGPKTRQSARLANTIFTLVLLILSGISAVGALFAPWVTSIFLVPGFSPEQQQLTAELMRIILVQTTIFGVSGVLSSILNAHQHFILPALAP